MFVGIVDSVVSRVLDLAQKPESDSPSAGEIGGDQPAEEVMQSIVPNVYGANANVAVASSDVSQPIAMPKQGDLEALKAMLRGLGLEEVEIGRLSKALVADAEAGLGAGELGSETSSWIGRFAASVALYWSQAGIGVSSGLVAQAIAS